MIPENMPELAADEYAKMCPGGVLGPTAAFGLVLHERLRNAGFELSIKDADKKTI
jgi:short subunit dehydrogenase-like uncharacterized protein